MSAHRGTLFWWYGGKALLSDWVADQLPDGAVYCEPFCGAASVYFRVWRRYEIRVLNDLDGRIINLFRVLQDEEMRRRLVKRLRWTPYSQDEFARALGTTESDDPVESAWAFFVTQNQGFGGKAGTLGYWGTSCESNNQESYCRKVRYLMQYARALHGAYISSECAIRCIERWDRTETVFYLDPPYAPDTRRSNDDYKHETDQSFHESLVRCLLQVKGRVVLSGFRTHIYNPLEDAGWTRIERVRALAAGNARLEQRRQKRTECLWINPQAQQHMKQPSLL